MPAIAFDDIDENLQPIPGWRFFVTLPDLPNLSTDGSVLSFLVQRFTGTHRGIQYEQVPFQGGVRNFPTGFHTDNINIVLVESQFVALKYLRAWCDLVVDDTGAFGLPANYKRSIGVDALDETGGVLESFGWDYCSPMIPDPFEWDGTNSHYLTAGCAFVTDGARNKGLDNSKRTIETGDVSDAGPVPDGQ